MEAIDPFVFRLSIFVLAIFVGYFVVWSVTPALHTPLMAVTNAISSVIVVGALIAVSVSSAKSINIAVDWNGRTTVNNELVAQNDKPFNSTEMKKYSETVFRKAREVGALADEHAWTSKSLGFAALILACVNIFGGFLVTGRMLAMYKKKEKPPSSSEAVGHTK